MTKRKVRNHKAMEQVGNGFELVPYVFDYLQDPRMIKAAQILSYSGYEKHSNTNNGAVTLAAKEAGVNRQTIYFWLKRDDFQTAIREAKNELCAVAVKGLRDHAIKKNPAVCMFLAQHLLPETYNQQHKKHLYEKELLELKRKYGMPIEDNEAVTSINLVVDSNSPERERNEIKK